MTSHCPRLALLALITTIGLCCRTTAVLFAGEPATESLVGDDLSSWQKKAGEWTVVGDAKMDPANEKRLAVESGAGVIYNGPKGRTVNLFSRLEHGDCEAHIEFLLPKGSNSGVYFQGRYEIQIFDSHGVEKPTYTDCGGVYQRMVDGRGIDGRSPEVNASRPAGEWQSFEVVFRAPRFDAAGKKTAPARFVKVVHNGQTIHENVDVAGPTRAAAFSDEKPRGPLMLQGDHGPIAYRNLRIKPLDGAAEETPAAPGERQ